MKQPAVRITDKPVRLNLHNVEQRLRKYRTLIAFLVDEIDDALKQLEAERKAS